jgi:hypothetical protein
MEQLAVIASLKEGSSEQARELLAHGPPFDAGTEGLTRHTVFLSSHDVVFVFEGHEVEWIVDDMATAPFRWNVLEAFDAWRPLVEGEPRVAQVAYTWDRGAAQGSA